MLLELLATANTFAPVAFFFDSDLLDTRTVILILGVLIVLGLLFFFGQYLKRQPESNFDPALIRNFNKRVVSWLTICALIVVSLLMDKVVAIGLFGCVSFWALREFITMTPTRRGDHRAIFWVLFLFTPLQYVLIGLDQYYTDDRIRHIIFTLFTVLIPVYASLFIPGRIAFTSDHVRFLERTAKIQFGLLICVYALSHAAALLNLESLTTWDASENAYVPWKGKTAGLLFFFIVIVQVSDMFHFIWDRVAGKYVIAPSVNATKTWEGLIGSALLTAVFGIAIQFFLPVTPFTWYGAGFMALLISVMASSGSMTMSAIKRDRGIKDYGTLVQGHAGVLDRIDSVCFAAPIFFHVTRLFLERPEKAQSIPDSVAMLWNASIVCF